MHVNVVCGIWWWIWWWSFCIMKSLYKNVECIIGERVLASRKMWIIIFKYIRKCFIKQIFWLKGLCKIIIYTKHIMYYVLWIIITTIEWMDKVTAHGNAMYREVWKVSCVIIIRKIQKVYHIHHHEL